MTQKELRNIARGNHRVACRQDQERLARQFQAAGLDVSSIYQDLEMESFYVDTHPDIGFGGAVIHQHSHSFYELICVRSACGVEYMIDTECVQVQPGDILFLPPGVPHQPLIPEQMPVPYARDVLWLSREFVQMVFHKLPESLALSEKGRLLRTAGSKWTQIPELFQKGIQETQAQQPHWELAVMGNTMTLLAQVCRLFLDYRHPPVRQPENQPLELALDYIDQHYREKISLADVAGHCFVSESTICHIFQQKMGVSFYRCLTQRRLITAKELILAGSTLEDVSKAVGFADYTAFYRAFKREYGISPRQFRSLSPGTGTDHRQ